MKGGEEGMRENIPSVISFIGAVFILSILPAQVHALTPDQVFDKVKDSIVVVKTSGRPRQGERPGERGAAPFREDRHQLPRCGRGCLLPGGPGQTDLSAPLYTRKTGTRTSASSMPRVLQGNQRNSARRRASRWGSRFMLWERRRAWNFPFPTASLRSSGVDRHP